MFLFDVGVLTPLITTRPQTHDYSILNDTIREPIRDFCPSTIAKKRKQQRTRNKATICRAAWEPLDTREGNWTRHPVFNEKHEYVNVGEGKRKTLARGKARGYGEV
jgi:hypothetical protein